MNSPDETRSLLSNTIPAVTIRVEKGEVRSSLTRFTHDFVIGRGAPCEVQLADLEVSLRHVEIVWENGQWWARDLNSPTARL